MGRSIFASLMVVCGGALGCLGYGALFGFVSSSMFEPSVDRALTFGLSFGMAAGVLIALICVGAETGTGFRAKLIPRLVGAALILFALHLLFWRGGWAIAFEGSEGFALASTTFWAFGTLWLAEEIS